MSGGPGLDDGHGRRVRRSAPLVLGVVAVLLATAPILASLVATWDGWASEGDSAVIALRARDVFSEPPLVGMPTTLGERSDRIVHHPGPLEFWLLAPLELSTGSRHAPLVSVALINLCCVVLVVVLLYRLVDARGAFLGSVLIGAILWPLRGEVLTDAFNPYVTVLPLALFLVSAIGVLSGVGWALPVGVIAGTYAAQAHVSVGAVVALVALGVTTAAVVHRQMPRRPMVVAAACCALVLWAPVLIDQVAGSGNTTGLLTAASSGSNAADRLGVARAEAVVSNSLGPVPLLARGSPRPARLLADPSIEARGVAVLIIGSAVLAIVARRRVLASAATSAAALAGLLALVGGAVGTVAIPTQFFNALAPHNYLWLLPTTAVLTSAVAVLVLRSRWALLGGCTAVAVVVAAFAEPAAPTGEVRREIPGLARDVVASLRDREGPFVVELTDDIHRYSVEAALVLEMERAGIDVSVPSRYAPAFGRHRAGEARQHLRVSIGQPDLPPAAGTTVAIAKPDAEALRDLRAARGDVVASIRRAGGAQVGGESMSVADAVAFVRTGQLAGMLRVGLARWDGMGPSSERLLSAESRNVRSVRVELVTAA